MAHWIKVVAGGLLVIVGTYVVVGEQISGVSADAIINAQVLTVRSPVDGIVTLSVSGLGNFLRSGDPLGSVTDPRPDDNRLIDLQRILATARNDLTRLEENGQAMERRRFAYVGQAASYEVARVRQLDANLAEANATAEAARARLRENEAILGRARELIRGGVQSAAQYDRARAAQEVSVQELEVARNRVRSMGVELASARQGVYLGESNNDAPSTLQRARELETRIAEGEVDSAERRRRITLLETQVSEEHVRLGLFREGWLTSPTQGVLWEIMTGSGEYVRRAQDVLRMVDCSTVVVTASVRESVYNSLTPGDPVRFRMTNNGQVFDGVVTRLAGSGAETIYRNLAVGPSLEHLKRYDVTVQVPTLLNNPEYGCAIGRTGRIVFTTRPLDFGRRVMVILGLD